MTKKTKHKKKFKFKTDIGFIAIITLLISIYPFTTPSIKLVNSKLKIDNFQYATIKNNYYCAEVNISGIFRNNWIKDGYIKNIDIKPRFMNPNIPENDYYIETKVKYIDKIKIKFLKKTKVTISILLYCNSLSFMKNKEFEIGFFDNNGKLIEHNKTKEPALIYFSYFEEYEKIK